MTPGRQLALSAALLVAAACSGSDGERSSSGSASSPTPAPTSTAAPSADPGASRSEGEVMGIGDYPAFTLRVPPGWVAGVFVTAPGPSVLGVSVWDVGEVPRDPCHWKKSTSDPGPTVDDLVGALTTQRFRHATRPREVTLGGAHGLALRWSVPTDWKVTGDAEFKGCDAADNGLRDFVSWFGNGEGERYQQVAGQVDMLWVLDVDGQRLLVDATYSPDATEADRAKLLAVVRSLRFT